MSPTPWAIFYGDGSVVRGETLDDWLAAPDTGVQGVIEYEPYPDHPDGTPNRPWAGVGDRRIYTGEDPYSINSWSAKAGTLIPDDQYFAIFERMKVE